MDGSVTIHEIYKVLSDITVDKKEFLRCLGLPPLKISEFEETSKENPEKAFQNSLEHFLACTEKGKEWDAIIDSLQQNGDTVTVEKINQIMTDEYSYCDFRSLPIKHNPIHNSTTSMPPVSIETPEKMTEYYEKLKTETTNRYNRSKRRIDECHNDVQKALDTEHRNAKTLLEDYKEQMKKTSNKLDIASKELIEKVTFQRKMIESSIAKLKCGDHSGIAALKSCEHEITDLKEQKKKADEGLKLYISDIHKHYGSESLTKDFVQGLQRVLTVSIHASGDIDEDDYMTFDELLNN